MPRNTTHRVLGFTLTEMAIVLAVVGVLVAGLWNIISGANTQMRDSSAASQQEQLIDAVKAFLNSNEGQNYLISNLITVANGGCGGPCPASPLNFGLPLPTSNACNDAAYTVDTNWPKFCTFLPPGFVSGTTNSYGQAYSIRILRDSTPVSQPPVTFSFMIMTTGGNNITDTSGARIASLIGGDGGFIYNNAICGATPTNACGSYSAWTVAPAATYGFGGGGTPAPAVGTVASRTYVSSQQNSLSDWLARIAMPGDATNFSLNTMQTPEYLGSHELIMGSFTPASGTQPALDKSIYMGDFSNLPAAAMPTAGGGNLNMQGGSINFVIPGSLAGGGVMNVQGGTINLNNAGSTTNGGTMNVQQGVINLNSAGAGVTGGTLQGYEGSQVNMTVLAPAELIPPYNNLINIAARCTADLANVNVAGLAQNATCQPGIQVSGDAKVLGRLAANSLYSVTFVYDSGGLISDMRLKKDIQPFHGGLSGVEKLKPVSYKLKSTGTESMGFLAQDIEKVYPDLIIETDDGYKAVNYNGLMAPLVSAVQELQRENEVLRAKLEKQESTLEILKKKAK